MNEKFDLLVRRDLDCCLLSHRSRFVCRDAMKHTWGKLMCVLVGHRPKRYPIYACPRCGEWLI